MKFEKVQNLELENVILTLEFKCMAENLKVSKIFIKNPELWEDEKPLYWSNSSDTKVENNLVYCRDIDVSAHADIPEKNMTTEDWEKLTVYGDWELLTRTSLQCFVHDHAGLIEDEDIMKIFLTLCYL